MQNDLEAEYPGLDIQLLGVNAFGHESGVGVATEGRVIPLLQDVDDDGNSLSDTWDLWDVEWRDVVILDADNIPVAVYNLTDNDLADPYSYEALKNLLVETANVEVNESSISGYVYFDTNNDGIRDAAELAISQVEISLSGTDDQGQPVNMTDSLGYRRELCIHRVAPGRLCRHSETTFNDHRRSRHDWFARRNRGG